MKIVRGLIGVVLIAALIYWVGTDEVLARLYDLPFWFIPFGLGYYTVCQLISTMRWQVLLRARGLDAGFWALFRLYMIGMFANNFLPGAVGGDAVKAIGLYREKQRGDVAVASVLVERFLGLAALGALGLAASIPLFAKGPHDWVVLMATVGAAGVITLVGLAVWSPPLSRPIAHALQKYSDRRIGKLFYEMFGATSIYWTQKQALVTGFALSVLVQALIGLYFVLTAFALEIELPVIYFFSFLPAITLVSLLPISIGGLGVREITMIFLFSRVGASSADILTVSLIIHALNTFLSLAGGVMLLRSRSGSKVAGEKSGA